MALAGREPAVEVRNVTYRYRGSNIDVLRDASFNVMTGSVTAVLGPNGAGKSTLLKCILGIYRPRKGSVLVFGRDVHSMKPSERARIFGYVPQSHNNAFSYRILDFIMLGRIPHHSMFSIPSKSEEDLVIHVSRELGISDLLDRFTSEVSGGQLQLVMIARALVQEAKILVLDEPTAHLDVSNAVKVLATVRNLVRRGRAAAAVISMHDPLLTSLFCDNAVVLSNGVVETFGPTNSVLNPEILERVYGVGFTSLKLSDKQVIIPKV